MNYILILEPQKDGRNFWLPYRCNSADEAISLAKQSPNIIMVEDECGKIIWMKK